jgi:hypothetical protein
MGYRMILEAMLAIVAKLEAAGIRATIDDKSMNPPAVLVQPPVINYRFSGRCYGADWTLLAVAPNTDKQAEVRALDGLIAAVRTALDGAPVQARPAGVFTTDGTATLPAYELTYSAKMEVTP